MFGYGFVYKSEHPTEICQVTINRLLSVKIMHSLAILQGTHVEKNF